MDTDVEVLKPLDSILAYEIVSGFESETQIPTGLMASQPKMPFMLELLQDYDNLHFVKSDGTLDLTTNVDRITQHCTKYGILLNNTFQTVNGFTFLPKDYLCPKSYEDGKIRLTENTLVIHHFAGSWYTPMEKLKQKIAKLLGKRLSSVLVKIKGVFVSK